MKGMFASRVKLLGWLTIYNQRGEGSMEYIHGIATSTTA